MKPTACILFRLAVLLFVMQANDGNAKDYQYIDSIMRCCPAQHTRSAEDIARYIASKFNSENDKLRAAYSWISQQISYDVGAMYVGLKYKYESEVVERVLKTRQTVCFGYVVTFKAIAAHLGLKIIVVRGYTKQNGKIDVIPHAWCAVKYNNRWRLIDPTWSSGYLSSGVFHRRFNDKWFLVHPDTMINTHIPFDPVWQFSYFPVNGNEFSAAKKADSVTSRFFSYPDTIKIIERLPEKERLIAENRRVLSMKYSNQMITQYVANNKASIEHIVYNENVDVYNRAVSLYNLATTMFNNKNLKSAKTKLNEASAVVNTINNPDKSLSASIKDLKKMINKLEYRIEKML